MLQKLTLMTVIVFGVLSCTNNESTAKIERVNQPDIHLLESQDAAMNNAIHKAKITLAKFDEAFYSDNKNYSGFAIKVKFNTADGGGEHMWLNDIKIKENGYVGKVNNIPEQTTEVKLGDIIDINTENISDWMYIDQGKLIGGYTIRAIRNLLSAPEKAQFDQDMGLIVEDYEIQTAIK